MLPRRLGKGQAFRVALRVHIRPLLMSFFGLKTGFNFWSIQLGAGLLLILTICDTVLTDSASPPDGDVAFTTSPILLLVGLLSQAWTLRTFQ